MLNNIHDNRLFTYKVAFDGGSAPNPYHKTCTLAICKPKIRSVAKINDIVAGFGCKNSIINNEDRRLIYVMQIDKVLSWEEYIKHCNNNLKGKIPKNELDPGDCIWESISYEHNPKQSWSRHDKNSFKLDVNSGKNVLLSNVFWYFGKGDKYRIELPDDLLNIVPNKQGHRSNANQIYKDKFIEWFNDIIITNNISIGKNGEPNFNSQYPTLVNDKECRSCIKLSNDSDNEEEEV